LLSQLGEREGSTEKIIKKQRKGTKDIHRVNRRKQDHQHPTCKPHAKQERKRGGRRQSFEKKKIREHASQLAPCFREDIVGEGKRKGSL